MDTTINFQNIWATKTHRVCKKKISGMNHTAFGYARWFDFFCSSANIFSVFLGVPNFYPVNAACCCGNIFFNGTGEPPLAIVQTLPSLIHSHESGISKVFSSSDISVITFCLTRRPSISTSIRFFSSKSLAVPSVGYCGTNFPLIATTELPPPREQICRRHLRQ